MPYARSSAHSFFKRPSDIFIHILYTYLFLVYIYFYVYNIICRYKKTGSNTAHALSPHSHQSRVITHAIANYD